MILKRKKIVGIEINEIIRNRFLMFDRYYHKEFGDEGIPENEQYVYDFFNTYKWEDTEETLSYLKDDLPEDMSFTEYHKDDGDKKNADDFLFHKEKISISAKEKYNQFMYQDYCLEIFGNAPMMYPNLNLDIDKLVKKYPNYEFILISDDNVFSIPPTFFFLSKNVIRLKKIIFLEKYKNIWKNVDIYITSNPDIIKKRTPLFKKIIPVLRPYNNNIIGNKKSIIQLKELLENKLLD